MASTYAQRMGRLASRIFGEVIRPTNSQSMKVEKLFSEKPIYMKPEVVEYYPKHKELSRLMIMVRRNGLFRDEAEDFKEEMKRLRRLRGKGTPKKGEGKRAKK